MEIRLRRNQLISPWGIGQIIPFEKEALMVAGLDLWEKVYRSLGDKEKEELIIRESRLERRLFVNHFRLPPDSRKRNDGRYIPMYRFPLWHMCPYCGTMQKQSLYQQKLQKCPGKNIPKPRTCYGKPEYKRREMIPVRFVTVCKKGHIQDFPFLEWVHRNKEIKPECESSLLYEVKGSFTALASIKITCLNCKNTDGSFLSRNMSRSFDKDELSKVKKCDGQRPWLGEVGSHANGCGEPLQTVQRGSSNVYFPFIKSSIYIPTEQVETEDPIRKIVDEKWDVLSVKVNGELDKDRIKVIAQTLNVDFDKLYSETIKKDKDELKDSQQDEEISEYKFRKEEYLALKVGLEKDTKDFHHRKKKISNYKWKMNEYFSSISLLHKLRETRALVGFSRLIPEDGRSTSEKKKFLKKNNYINWLPAIIVRGEGIFLELDGHKIDSWLNTSISKRITKLEKNYNDFRSGYELPPREVNAKFVLLHTLSHIIINELGIRCGYSSASLRERIYCDIKAGEEKMNGILIYTSSGDSEGSLGGLVKQGQPGYLEETIITALEKAKWCSNDPICIESEGQGPGSSNLAACHNCVLLPETSCEEGNRLLDRALLIGTLKDKKLGYFNQ